MTEGINKYREGLKLAIEGLLEYTLKFVDENPVGKDQTDSISQTIRGATEYRMEKVKEYIHELETYTPLILGGEDIDLEGLKLRYNLAKGELGLK